MNNNPYHHNPYHNQYPYYSHNIKEETLMIVEPYVRYGLKEAKHTSYPHAMREIAAISYLIGKGYDPRMAYQMVESWELNEMFYTKED